MQTPDSSEVAKHLRASHLALVLGCVLVLTILFGGSPSQIDKAHKQFQSITSIKENWSSWTRRFGHEQLTWHRENGITPPNILPSQLFINPEDLARRGLPTQTHEWAVNTNIRCIFYIYIRRPPTNLNREEILAWAQNTEHGIEVNAGQSDAGDSPIFKSLQGFRYF